MLPSRYFPALLALALLSCIIPYGLNAEESTCGVSSAVGGCPAKVDSNKILTGHLPRQVTIVQWVQKNDFLADKYTCNSGSMQCEVTLDRQRIRDRNTAAVIWHSCDIDLLDMPRFRAPHHSWILFNDESPCGHVVQQVPECLQLFNLTAGLRMEHVWPQSLLAILLRLTPEELQVLAITHVFPFGAFWACFPILFLLAWFFLVFLFFFLRLTVCFLWN